VEFFYFVLFSIRYLGLGKHMEAGFNWFHAWSEGKWLAVDSLLHCLVPKGFSERRSTKKGCDNKIAKFTKNTTVGVVSLSDGIMPCIALQNCMAWHGISGMVYTWGTRNSGERATCFSVAIFIFSWDGGVLLVSFPFLSCPRRDSRAKGMV
jgi:hypothetical protein